MIGMLTRKDVNRISWGLFEVKLSFTKWHKIIEKNWKKMISKKIIFYVMKQTKNDDPFGKLIFQQQEPQFVSFKVFWAQTHLTTLHLTPLWADDEEGF